MSKGFAELYRKAAQSPVYQSEKLRLAFAFQVCEAMAERGVSRAELAKRIETSAAYVTKLLRGDANVTLDTIAKVSGALGLSSDIRLGELATTTYRQVAHASGATESATDGRLDAPASVQGDEAY